MASLHLLNPTLLSASNPRSSPLPGLPPCSNMAELKQFHSQIIRLGRSTDNDSIGRVIKFCSVDENGDLNYALQVFDAIPEPDAFIYNTLMRGYLKRELPRGCFSVYSQMLLDSVPPNRFTFPSVIRACSVGYAIKEGKQIHAHVLKFGFGKDNFCQNNLIHMHVNFESMDDARKVFDKMLVWDAVAWTTLITGYSRQGNVDNAFEIFESTPEGHHSSASWNAMIACFVQNNRYQEAFKLFERMRKEGILLDKFVAASILSACTGLGALEQGKSIHQFIERSGMELDSKLTTTIIDMYCKCGCVEKALECFNRLPKKGISSWNCMIGGLAMHGKGQEAIELFKEMEKKTITPDSITMLNVLSACAHSGLIEEGRYYFQNFVEIHGVEPKTEHYGCLVDMLGRAGKLEEAKDTIATMPMSPDAGVLGALVGACRIHGNVELGEAIGRQVIELEPNNSGRYILLANLYADSGQWEEVARVRKLMNDRKVKKAPGFSMIEIKGEVNEFIAGGRGHPATQEIYEKMNEMLECIKKIGYIPETNEWTQNIEEDEKENPLNYHSEKLAIGYGLLKTKAGETLRITKNLRVCTDCHEASKFISKFYEREIVVRDRNRFHHFVGGECSCSDYW